MKYKCLIDTDDLGLLGVFCVVGNFSRDDIKDYFRNNSSDLRKKFQKQVDKKPHLKFKNFQIIFLSDDGVVYGDFPACNFMDRLVLNFNNEEVRIKFIQDIYDNGYII